MMNKAQLHGSPPTGATEWTEEQKIQTEIDFHQLFYDSAETTWKTMTWMDVPVQKNPMDLWVYQELLYQVRPDVIIETGTLYGGSARYLCDVGNLIVTGMKVITVDIRPLTEIRHPHIIQFIGSSVSDQVFENITELLNMWRSYKSLRVMIILDSDHEYSHVLREMELYGPLVTPGSYMIVEDTNLNGNPVWPTYGPGPNEAVKGFLPHHPEFQRDEDCERLMLTFNRDGYLRKVES
jgi:cephalosporin hydroxylase